MSEQPNVVVEYVDADNRRVLYRDEFYDPGLDENSWLALEMKRDGRWHGPYLAYNCGARIR